MILSITPNLMVADVKKSVKFYEDCLDLKLIAWVENEQDETIYDFAIVGSDYVQLMLQSAETLQNEVPELKRENMGQGGTLFIKVMDVNGLHKKLSGKAKYLNELHETFYGTLEFNIQDPDGNILTLAQDLEDPLDESDS